MQSSPCVKICELDSQGMCKGCLRSMQEIASWLGMSAEQRAAVTADLPKRRAQLEQVEAASLNA